MCVYLETETYHVTCWPLLVRVPLPAGSAGGPRRAGGRWDSTTVGPRVCCVAGARKRPLWGAYFLCVCAALWSSLPLRLSYPVWPKHPFVSVCDSWARRRTNKLGPCGNVVCKKGRERFMNAERTMTGAPRRHSERLSRIEIHATGTSNHRSSRMQ